MHYPGMNFKKLGQAMKRRQLSHLLGALLGSTSFPAFGQSKDKPTVGVLWPGTEAQCRPFLEALRKGLNEKGLIDGSSMRLVVRYADNRFEQLPDLARDLTTQGSRMIVAGGTTSVSAAQRAAPELPVVMAGTADPVAMGFARSLVRPGGRITGISILGEEFVGKQLEMLKEAVPAARTFAIFLHALNPGNPVFRRNFDNISRALGVRIDVMDIRAPLEEFPAMFDRAVQQSADGVLVFAEPIFDSHRETIFRLALERRLPTMVGFVPWVRAGALLAYAVDLVDAWRQAARYVSEILRGADPATLPIEQPTIFQVAINMRTARTLGIELPPLILARADEVID